MSAISISSNTIQCKNETGTGIYTNTGVVNGNYFTTNLIGSTESSIPDSNGIIMVSNSNQGTFDYDVQQISSPTTMIPSGTFLASIIDGPTVTYTYDTNVSSIPCAYSDKIALVIVDYYCNIRNKNVSFYISDTSKVIYQFTNARSNNPYPACMFALFLVKPVTDGSTPDENGIISLPLITTTSIRYFLHVTVMPYPITTQV